MLRVFVLLARCTRRFSTLLSDSRAPGHRTQLDDCFPVAPQRCACAVCRVSVVVPSMTPCLLHRVSLVEQCSGWRAPLCSSWAASSCATSGGARTQLRLLYSEWPSSSTSCPSSSGEPSVAAIAAEYLEVGMLRARSYSHSSKQMHMSSTCSLNNPLCAVRWQLSSRDGTTCDHRLSSHTR